MQVEIHPALSRYSEAERSIIEAYFRVIALTRKSGKVSSGIIQKELAYWEKRPVELVIRALDTHIKKHHGKPERYTRGILRILEAQHANNRGDHGVTPAEGGRGEYGRGDSRYIGDNDPLPI